jgi:hypothetical protein
MVNNAEQTQMSIDTQISDLKLIIELLLADPDNMHPDLKAMAEAEMQRRRDRIARNNARFERLLSQMTNKQANAVSMLESNGYKINQVFYKKSKPYGNVAVMMVKEQVWNGDKGRMGRKLLVAYADGTNASTFEKSISMRPVF